MVKKLVSGVLLGALAVSLVMPGADAWAAKKTSLKQKRITIFAGKTKKIQIRNKKKKRKYVFSSSKKKIASVNKNGVVRGKKAGKAVITVKETYQVKKKNKVIGKVKVTVKKKTVPVKKTPVPVPGPTALPSTAPVINPPAASHDPSADVKTEPAFYVSPEGDDHGDGSSSHPFKTLARAKEAVRGLDKSKGDIIVEIADGFYPVEDTILFDSKDSGTEQGAVIYRAAEGASPVFSGGRKLEASWQKAEDVNWLRDGVTAYKVPLERSEKLRAIYVNGERASMTSKSQKPVKAVGAGSYTVTKGQAEWAWAPSTTKIYTGAVFSAAFGLPADTRNPQNIELESGSTWAQQLVCAESLSLTEEGDTQVNLQMPYGALAQNLGWNTEYSPTKSNDVTNVFEWLEKPGEFYFDQAGSMLYYIPREGEDINSAEVIIPETDTIIEM